MPAQTFALAAQDERHASIIADQGSVTPVVLAAMGGAEDPRLREIMEAFVRHMHAFASEVRLTEEEFQLGVDFLNRVGQATHDPHNEGVLFSDAIGFSTSSASSTTAKAAQPKRPPPCLARSGGCIRRRRERRLDRALADPGPPCSRPAASPTPSTSLAGRRGGRLAGLAGGPLRESGREPGGYEPARQVHHGRRWPLLFPVGQAGWLSGADGWPGRRFLAGAEEKPYRPAHLHFLCLQAGLQDAGHPGVRRR